MSIGPIDWVNFLPGIGLFLLFLILKYSQGLKYLEDRLLAAWKLLQRGGSFGFRSYRRVRLQIKLRRFAEAAGARDGVLPSLVRVRWLRKKELTSYRQGKDNVVLILRPDERADLNLLFGLQEFLAHAAFRRLSNYISKPQANAIQAITAIRLLERCGEKVLREEYVKTFIGDARLEPDLYRVFRRIDELHTRGFLDTMFLPELCRLEELLEETSAGPDVEVEFDRLLAYIGQIAKRRRGEDIDLFFRGTYLSILTMIVGRPMTVERGAALYRNFLAKFTSVTLPNSIYLAGPLPNIEIIRTLQRDLEKKDYIRKSHTAHRIRLGVKAGSITVEVVTIALQLKAEAGKTSGLFSEPPREFVLPEPGNVVVGAWAVVTEWSEDSGKGKVTLLDSPETEARFTSRQVVNPASLTILYAPVLVDLRRTQSGYLKVESLSLLDAESCTLQAEMPLVANFESADRDPWSLLGPDDVRRNVPGFVKYYNAEKSFGFMAASDNPAATIYFTLSNCINPPSTVVTSMPVIADIRKSSEGGYRCDSVFFASVSSPRYEGDPVPALFSAAAGAYGNALDIPVGTTRRGLRGYVKRYNPEQRYGFITPTDYPSADIWFQLSACINPPLSVLKSMPVVVDAKVGNGGDYRCESVFFIPVTEPRYTGDTLHTLYQESTALGTRLADTQPGDVVRGLSGYVKRYSPFSGFGFIISPEDPSCDIFFRFDKCVNPPDDVTMSLPVLIDVKRTHQGDYQCESVFFLELF